MTELELQIDKWLAHQMEHPFRPPNPLYRPVVMALRACEGQPVCIIEAFGLNRPCHLPH